MRPPVSGCRCILDEEIRCKSRSKPVHIELNKQAGSSGSDHHTDSMQHVDVNHEVTALGGTKKERMLRELCSERKLGYKIQCCSWAGVLGKGGHWITSGLGSLVKSERGVGIGFCKPGKRD